MKKKLNQLSVKEVANKISSGETTSVKVVESCLERISEREKEINAWAYIDPKLALENALKTDKKNPKGLLHGVPFGVKDIIDTCYPYNHWTHKEIMEQPQFIESALNNGGRIINDNVKLGGITQLLKLINNNLQNIKHIMIFGCGTSYHACMLSKYYFTASCKNEYNCR